MLRYAGTTTEGRPVLSGMSYFTNTQGLPLEIVLMWCQEKDFVIDWLDYIAGCVADGHNLRTIESRIYSACLDVYGREYAKEVQKRLCSNSVSVSTPPSYRGSVG